MSTNALAKNTAMQIAGKSLSTLFGLLTVAVLTRYLGAAGYGELTIALTFLSVFAVIVDFGLTLTTTQMISEHKAQEEKLLGNLLSLRIISAIAFLALAPVVALGFPYDPIVKVAIAVGAFSYLFGTTSQMLVGVFQKRLVIGRFVLAELLNRGAVLVGTIIAPLFDVGVVGIMWILVAGNALQLLSIFAFAGKYVQLRLQLQWSTWKEIISRSWPIGASIFFNLIYLRGDIVFLSLYRDAAEVGVYGAAYKVVDVVAAVPVMFMGLALPLLVATWSKGEKTDYKKQLQQFLDFLAIIALPIALGSIAVGPNLMELIAGPEFRASGEVLRLLGPAAAVVFFGSLFGHAIVSLNKQKPMTWGYLIVAVITVAGYLLFIPKHGMWAAAWWTLISEVLITAITMIVVMRVSRFRPKLKTVAIAALSALIMYAGLFIIPPTHVLFEVLMGALIYTVALVALGGPRPTQIAKLFLPEKPPISQP